VNGEDAKGLPPRLWTRIRSNPLKTKSTRLLPSSMPLFAPSLISCFQNLCPCGPPYFVLFSRIIYHCSWLSVSIFFQYFSICPSPSAHWTTCIFFFFFFRAYHRSCIFDFVSVPILYTMFMIYVFAESDF